MEIEKCITVAVKSRSGLDTTVYFSSSFDGGDSKYEVCKAALRYLEGVLEAGVSAELRINVTK